MLLYISYTYNLFDKMSLLKMLLNIHVFVFWADGLILHKKRMVCYVLLEPSQSL